MTSVLRNTLLSRFVCTGDACVDTCCKQWSMQVDERTLTHYRQDAPELLNAVEQEDGGYIMRKSPQTGYCVKLDGGLCGIHQNYGKTFLGDACFFYPRVTRSLGDEVLMTATLSCPEIARLAVVENNDWDLEPTDLDRLPQQLKNYLPDGVSASDALAVHKAFLAATEDESASAETIFARIASVSRSFELLDAAKWPQAVGFYLRSTDGRLPPAQPELTDPFNLVHALCGLIVASGKPVTPRLQKLIDDMTHALHITLDWKNVQMELCDDSLEAYDALQLQWQEKWAPVYAPMLRRWLKMQLALALFPYAGLGDTLSERITIIGVRLATLRLAILCSCGMAENTLAEEDAVRVVQTLSRVLDHLGSSQFSLDIYAEPKWLAEARMLGLLGL